MVRLAAQTESGELKLCGGLVVDCESKPQTTKFAEPRRQQNVQMRRGRPQRKDGGGGFGASEGGWCIPEKCEGRQAMNGHLTSVWEKLQHGVGDLH
mmetsp:Transcript_19668/g.68384  ORF Transcript_19668/g.68384 Transcript_19668/m.68384 type:complete len:96 (+) Transcript_19668:62-349(+)